MMIRLRYLVQTVLIGCLGLWHWQALAAEPVETYETPQAAAADPDFAWQGEYANQGKVGVQVVAQGKGNFLVVVFRGGLPGAGWDGKERETSEEDLAGVKDRLAALGVKKENRQSPTLEAKPPAGAVVLFDGTEESLKKHWDPKARRTDDGLLMQGCTSSDTFQDYSLHVEFRLPYLPAARGQARGNSGVYYQGRFETQVLDSFGLEGKDNEAGGIYSIRAPDLNMCLPPLVWQTYDADFTAARWDGAKKIADARLTVRLNGVTVQPDVGLPHSTTAAPKNEGPEAGPVYLQDHGNPVRYRNIWALPRDAKLESRRPIVPGAERLVSANQKVADSVSNEELQGMVLLGELGCARCHDAGNTSELLVKQAPILDTVGTRAQVEWMSKFLLDPHATKPGTMMPDVLRNLPATEREEQAKALVHFLATTGQAKASGSDRNTAQQGEELFHQIGCVACHAPQPVASSAHKPATKEAEEAVAKVQRAATTVPLIDLEHKYTVTSLQAFLVEPHKVRPSGRMPSFHLDQDRAKKLASYLLRDAVVSVKDANVKFAVYEGSWNAFPNFQKLKPVRTGVCSAHVGAH